MWRTTRCPAAWNACNDVDTDCTTLCVVSFPQPIALAATFNTSLLTLIGTAISDEARAYYNAQSRSDPNATNFLSCWAPNINIFRDPRWGRGSETYSEDPALSRYAIHP